MSSHRPYVTIKEQPAGRQQRFRYLSEVDGARSVGSIPGVNSTPERRTFPAIQVHGYKGPFVVLLSLLNPVNNLVHPHSITGSDQRYICNHGVIFVISEEPDVVFKNIGILCVKGKTEKDVKAQLKLRKQMNIDPLGAGWSHIYDHRQIDFTAVRLCFQVFLPGKDWTPADRNDVLKYNQPLSPVVSDVVYDAKKLTDLKIVHINSCAGPLAGGNEMTLLCDKYIGQNPDVVFEDECGWKQKATATLHHKQLAIVFIAPAYPAPKDRENLKVKVYLQQTTTSDHGVTTTKKSEPATVEYIRDQNGSPIKYPTRPRSPKSSITLKQVRIPQRPCPDSPEDICMKRWRPWGRREPPRDSSTTDAEEDVSSHQISQIYIRELENTAPVQIDMDGRSEVIPLFDPKNPELHAREWISTIDQLGDEFNWSDAVKSYYMQKRLSGIGKDWLSTLRHSDSWTWLEWKQKLLEAFPRQPRKEINNDYARKQVDYYDLVKEMLATRKFESDMMRSYDKTRLFTHDINAKKAYASLVEGWPLHMRTPDHCEHQQTRHSLPYTHLLDREGPRSAPQMQPLNLNKSNHLNTMDVEEDFKRFPDLDHRLDANGQDNSPRRYCYCNEEKGRVIRCGPPSRQNETRPSCIIQRNQIPLEKSWHRPCSTLPSSISDPSISRPSSEWLADQLRLILTADSLKAKAEEKVAPREMDHVLRLPVLNQAEGIDHAKRNPFDGYVQDVNITSRQMNRKDYIYQNTIIGNARQYNNQNLHVENRNQTINNSLPSTSGADNLDLSLMDTTFARSPQGMTAKVKRTPSRVNDSGEISPKRSLNSCMFPCNIPTYDNTNNQIESTNRPIPNSVASGAASCTDEEPERVNNTEEIIELACTLLGEKAMEELRTAVAKEEQWHSGILRNDPNLSINEPSQHNYDHLGNGYRIPNNINQNLPINHDQIRPDHVGQLHNNDNQIIAIDFDHILPYNYENHEIALLNDPYNNEVVNVSRELGRMNFEDKDYPS